MKKRIAAILTLALCALLVLASCSDYADYPEYRDVVHRESGLELTLRNDMSRYDSENYDLYFTNTIASMALAASKADAQMLAQVGAPEDADAQTYADVIIKRNEFDREMIYYSYDESRKSCTFRYSAGDEGESGVFYYVVIIGEAGNLWYVEMVCSEADSGLYVDRFDSWAKALRTYDAE